MELTAVYSSEATNTSCPYLHVASYLTPVQSIPSTLDEENSIETQILSLLPLLVWLSG